MSDKTSSELMVEIRYRAVPEWLRQSKRWLVFRLEQKGGAKKTKVPYYVNGRRRSGTLDAQEDTEKLGTFEQAIIACAREGFDGLGFALGKDIDGQFWQGIDLDDVNENKHLKPLVSELEGYVELSPSGNGYHAIGKGEFFRGGRKEVGVEAYAAGRFFTVTGKVAEGAGSSEAPVDLKPWLVKRDWAGSTDKFYEPGANQNEIYTGSPEEIDPETRADLLSALYKIDGSGYDEWLKVGMALKTLEGGFELWSNWSRSWPVPNPPSDAELLRKWERDIVPNRTNWRSIFKQAQELGWVNPASKEARALAEQEAAAPQPLKFETAPENILDIKPIEFIIDGQIPIGSLVIAGSPGVGKTTMLASLVTLITHLCPPYAPMVPKVRRRVVWITEDVDQIWRLFSAMLNENAMVADRTSLSDMIKIVRADRSDPNLLASQLALLPSELDVLNHYDRGEHIAKPLIILDTVSATINIEDENSNSKVSQAVAKVRQAIPSSSVWFIAHTAKNHTRGTAVEEITARGAGAFGGDVQGTAIMVREEGVDDKRYFVLGKKRIAADKNEITATVAYYHTTTHAVWGDRNERFAYASLEATDYQDREADREEATEGSVEVRFNAAFDRFKELLADLRAEGRSGYIVRDARGNSPVIPAKYSNYVRIGTRDLATECRIKGNERKSEFWAQLKSAQWAKIDGEWVVFDVAISTIEDLKNHD